MMGWLITIYVVSLLGSIGVIYWMARQDLNAGIDLTLDTALLMTLLALMPIINTLLLLCSVVAFILFESENIVLIKGKE